MSARARRGEIVLFDFGATEARAMRKRRPALVIQNDAGNAHAPATIVAAIHHETFKGLPIHVPIPARVGGLDKDSVVDCGILATVRWDDLGRSIGRLPPEYMSRVDAALKLSLQLR